MRETRLMATTAITPALWGTTYVVTTQLLPEHRPLLAGALRALPAGLLLTAAVAIGAGRRTRGRDALPRGIWWRRAAILGGLNIGLFFALLFVAAYRLPGGVAAVLGAAGPFVVAAFGFALFRERSPRRVLLAAAIGMGGVALLVLRATASLDPIGLAAAAGGVVTMSLGTVLGRRWGLPEWFGGRTTAVLALTGWQLSIGGLRLLPVAVVLEGPVPALNAGNLAGFGYLSIVGTALAYFLWFRGVTGGLAPTRVTLLALLSPVTAAALGWVVLDQAFSAGQLLGAAAVLGAVLLGASVPAATRAPAPAQADAPAHVQADARAHGQPHASALAAPHEAPASGRDGGWPADRLDPVGCPAASR